MIAVIDKKYERKPQDEYSYTFWIMRLEEEKEELEEALHESEDAVMDELADMSNIIDYMYEKALTKALSTNKC